MNWPCGKISLREMLVRRIRGDGWSPALLFL
jgi:hypothetical protein